MENDVLALLRNIGAEKNNEYLLMAEVDTPLLGVSNGLDSLGIVNLMMDLEEFIYEETEKDIVIADDTMMSLTTSPFRNIKTLTLHINQILQIL